MFIDTAATFLDNNIQGSKSYIWNNDEQSTFVRDQRNFQVSQQISEHDMRFLHYDRMVGGDLRDIEMLMKQCRLSLPP